MSAAVARIVPIGDAALLVELGDAIDEAINAQVLNLAAALRRDEEPAISDIVPTYRSLLVRFDPDLLERAQLQARLETLLDQIDEAAPAGRLWSVPVVYGGAFGVDLEAVAGAKGIAASELAKRHAATTYRVFMIGFQPGFAYLGGLDPALGHPRRAEPRPVTPAGSIAIGGAQTAITSVAAPSGWHLLGRTPIRLFAPTRTPPFLLEAGDRVRLHPIAAAEWDALDARAEAGDPIARVIA